MPHNSTHLCNNAYSRADMSILPALRAYMSEGDILAGGGPTPPGGGAFYMYTPLRQLDAFSQTGKLRLHFHHDERPAKRFRPAVMPLFFLKELDAFSHLESNNAM